MRAREEKHTSGQIALVISIISLYLSGWVAYTGNLSAPNVQISFNDPTWIRLGDASAKDSDPYASGEVALIVTCSLTNSGARTGVVEDILLRVQSEDVSDKWLFFPLFQIDNTKLMVSKTTASPNIPSTVVGGYLPNAMMGHFYPVGISGKQSVVLTYLFKPVDDVSKFKYTKLTQQTYEIKALIRMMDGTTYTEGKKITVKMSSPSIDIINSGQANQIQSNEEHGAQESVN